MLISRFNKCSTNVKLTLFTTFCMSVYDLERWKYFSVTVFNKFRSCYNKMYQETVSFSKTS